MNQITLTSWQIAALHREFGKERAVTLTVLGREPLKGIDAQVIVGMAFSDDTLERVKIIKPDGSSPGDEPPTQEVSS